MTQHDSKHKPVPLDDIEAYRELEAIHQKSARRRELYGRTLPREGLCAFDAYGMDVVEGRA